MVAKTQMSQGQVSKGFLQEPAIGMKEPGAKVIIVEFLGFGTSLNS